MSKVVSFVRTLVADVHSGKAKKALGTLAGGVAAVVASGVLSGGALTVALGVLSIAGALGVYSIKNKPSA